MPNPSEIARIAADEKEKNVLHLEAMAKRDAFQAEYDAKAAEQLSAIETHIATTEAHLNEVRQRSQELAELAPKLSVEYWLEARK